MFKSFWNQRPLLGVNSQDFLTISMKSLMDVVQSALRGSKCGNELKERVDTPK